MGKSKSSGIGAASSILTGCIVITAIAISEILSSASGTTIRDAAFVSGLTVVGSLVGGGTIAGIIITAVPVMCGLAGFSLYKLYKA